MNFLSEIVPVNVVWNFILHKRWVLNFSRQSRLWSIKSLIIFKINQKLAFKVQLNCEKISLKNANKSMIIFLLLHLVLLNEAVGKFHIYVYFREEISETAAQKCSSSSNYLWFISIEFKCGTHNSKVKCFISYLKFDAMKRKSWALRA